MLKEVWGGLIRFVQEINTTSSRILVSIILATIIVLSTLIMMFLELKIDIAVLAALCAFVVSLGGLDVLQYKTKRETFIPETTSATDSNSTVANRIIGNEHGVEFTP